MMKTCSSDLHHKKKCKLWNWISFVDTGTKVPTTVNSRFHSNQYTMRISLGDAWSRTAILFSKLTTVQWPDDVLLGTYSYKLLLFLAFSVIEPQWKMRSFCVKCFFFIHRPILWSVVGSLKLWRAIWIHFSAVLS